MGLDVLLFDKNDKLVSMFEIDEALHKEIFSSQKRWASYLFLRKLNDYYRTDVEFSGKALEGLIFDLINYKTLMAAEYQTTFLALLDAISDKKVKKIRVNGD
jgi:hypothetical protein